jgi:outer membrane protein TolC
LAGAEKARGLKTYSLDQLLETALQYSPELKEAEEDITISKSELQQADAGMWPQLDATAIIGPTVTASAPTVTVNTTPTNGAYRGTVDQTLGGALTVFGSLDFTLSQPVYTFGRISNSRDAARHGVAAKSASKTRVRNDLVRRVKQYYYAAIIARQGKGAADDAGAFAAEARRIITKLVALKAKTADEIDLYRLDAFESSIKDFKIKAETGRRTATAALQRTVGLPPDEEFDLDLKELPRESRPLLSEQAYISQALGQRPEFTELKEGIEAQHSLVEAARAELFPTIYLAAIGSFAGAPERAEFDNPYVIDEFNHHYGGVLLGAQWHFDFGITAGKIRKAAAERQKLLYSQQYAEENIPLEVTQYYQNAVEKENGSKVYEQGAKSARRWLVASLANFDLGVGTAWDVFEALNAYSKNQGDYLTALYDYHIALANLDYAVGRYLEDLPVRTPDKIPDPTPAMEHHD